MHGRSSETIKNKEIKKNERKGKEQEQETVKESDANSQGGGACHSLHEFTNKLRAPRYNTSKGQ